MNKSLLISKLRSKLKKGEVSCGSWQQIPHPSISELLASENYDWICVDLEHGSIDFSQLPILFCAIERYNVLPFARLGKSDSYHAHMALEAGAAGIIFPMISCGDQIKSLIQDSSWPPSGNRGVGFSRACLYGKSFESHKNLARNPFFVAMIESKEGVRNLESIVSIEDLDAVIIGPYDLSASFNLLGDFNSHEFKEILTNIKNICKKYSKPFGIHIVEPSIKKYNEALAEGYNFISYSTDALFFQASSQKPG